YKGEVENGIFNKKVVGSNIRILIYSGLKYFTDNIRVIIDPVTGLIIGLEYIKFKFKYPVETGEDLEEYHLYPYTSSTLYSSGNSGGHIMVDMKNPKYSLLFDAPNENWSYKEVIPKELYTFEQKFRKQIKELTDPNLTMMEVNM